MRRHWVWAAAMWAIAGSTGCDTAEELAAGEPSPDAAPFVDASADVDADASTDATADADASADGGDAGDADAASADGGDAGDADATGTDAADDADDADATGTDAADDAGDADATGTDAADDADDADATGTDAADDAGDADAMDPADGGDEDAPADAADEGDAIALVPTYANDVKPIFAAKCTPCHTGNGSGGHNMGTSYADTQLNSYYCPGKTKGECSIVRIHDGSMPQGAGCTGDPATDASNSACTTAAQQQTITAWIAGGMLP